MTTLTTKSFGGDQPGCGHLMNRICERTIDGRTCVKLDSSLVCSFLSSSFGDSHLGLRRAGVNFVGGLRVIFSGNSVVHDQRLCQEFELRFGEGETRHAHV